MCKSIIYREYKECDFYDILKITLNTWEYEKYLSYDTAKLAAELDLLCYLNEQNIIYVAQADDKVIGFIIGKIASEHSNGIFSSRICKLKSMIRKRKEALLISLFRYKMSRINKKLLSSSNINYDAELQFFAIDKNYRGLGVGKQLFNMYLDYINNKGAETVKVFL